MHREKMTEYFETYLKEIKFEKYLEKLKKKIGRKSIILYGAGAYFQYIQTNYDLSGLNITGISDMKFSESDEGRDYLGYKIIPKNKICGYNPDYILVATLNYLSIIEDFKLNYFCHTKTKIYPLARMPLSMLIKEIWNS